METSTTLKRCNHCNQMLPRISFWKNRSRPDGLHDGCKTCHAEASRQSKLRGRPGGAPAEKWCPGCEKTVPRDGWDSNAGARDRLQSFCKECHHKKNSDVYKKRKAADPEWYKRSLAACAVRNLKRKLKRDGLDVPTYELLVSRGCAICGGPPTGSGRGSYMFDHNHKTGKFRGLLCSQCNTGIGLFRDNPDLLLKAIAYLKNNHEAANG